MAPLKLFHFTKENDHLVFVLHGCFGFDVFYKKNDNTTM